MKLRLVILILFICIYDLAISQMITRGPYLTMATQNSVTISWRTDIACNSKVKYGHAVGDYTGAIVNSNLVTEHVIKLSGLLPATKYFYTIGTISNILQGNNENYFKTLPISSSGFQKTIRLLAVGDVAKATVNEERVRDAFIKHVDTNYIDGYLMLGDNAYPWGTDQDFQNGFFNYFQNTITKHTVLWPAIGNHEYANDITLRKTHAIPYFDIFTLPTQGECGGIASNTELYYSFNIGNVHFVNLDSYGWEEVGGNYYGLIDTLYSPQINWLKQDLSANTLPWVIVSFHHPPYCMGTHNSDLEYDLVLIREKLNPILERYNVDLVLNGHCHTYQRSQLIREHYGMENTFDSTIHQVQNSSGFNDSSQYSCPFVKNSNPPKASDSGLIYMVIGSGSAPPTAPHSSWPHQAMYYSNYVDNGSLLLTITDNRLVAEWISTDTNQVIKDRFIMYKNVNRKNHMMVNSGQTITLNAGWDKENDYLWSTGDTTKQIIITPLTPKVLTVTNKNHCLTDSFFIAISINSITEIKDQSITISPNPVQDKLNIEGLKPGNYVLTFFDSSGEKVIQNEYIVKSQSNKLVVPLQVLSNGQYVLKILSDGKPIINSRIEKISQ